MSGFSQNIVSPGEHFLSHTMQYIQRSKLVYNKPTQPPAGKISSLIDGGLLLIGLNLANCGMNANDVTGHRE